MADKAIFTSSEITSVTRNQKGGTAACKCSLTQQLCETMDWPEMPDRWTGGNPEGSLAATVATITPNQDAFKRHAFELEVTKVDAFEVVRIEEKGKHAKAKGKKIQLKYTMHFSDKAGARKIEQHLLTCGDAPCKIAVSYTRQEILPMEEPGKPADEQQGSLEGQVEQIIKTSKKKDI
jgi:hypothetical protein